MAQTYGPTGEGVKPKLGNSVVDSAAQPGGNSKISVSSGDIPEFAGPAVKNSGERKPPAGGAAPDFASPGGPQGWTHGKK
jgi:hypothetical protein